MWLIVPILYSAARNMWEVVCCRVLIRAPALSHNSMSCKNTMKLYLPHILKLGIVAILTLPVALAGSITQPPQAMPSPYSYPRIATSTTYTTFHDLRAKIIEPTSIPELRRQLKRQNSPFDTLGWKDPSTCNVGVCDSGTRSTVFVSDGVRANTVTGVCCGTYVNPLSTVI